MAETKPTNTVDWVATGAIVEPIAGVKTSGYASGDKPPAKYFNWFWELVTQWFVWTNERLFDGATAVDFTIKCPVTEAGDLTLEGGSSAAGTDEAGGDAILSGAATTGNEGSFATLKAATAAASGAGVNTPEAYLHADGENDQVTIVKPLGTLLGAVATNGVDAITATGQAEAAGSAVTAGTGVVAAGGAAGSASSNQAGHGLEAAGGAAVSGSNGGDGIVAVGGVGTPPGIGIEATGGAGLTSSPGAKGAEIEGGLGATNQIGGVGMTLGGGDADNGYGNIGATGLVVSGGAGGSGQEPGMAIETLGSVGVEATCSASTGGVNFLSIRGNVNNVDIHLTPAAGSPSSPVNGDIWWDNSTPGLTELKVRMNGVTRTITVT